jgi:uncharacterized protein (DUF736 family)
MAQIGKFTKGKDGNYSGTIRTLTINVKVTLEAQPAGNENTPSHMVKADGAEIGAAWPKTSKEGNTYLSLKLDDPSFPMPVYGTLTAADNGAGYNLYWTRPGTAKRNGG